MATGSDGVASNGRGRKDREAGGPSLPNDRDALDPANVAEQLFLSLTQQSAQWAPSPPSLRPLVDTPHVPSDRNGATPPDEVSLRELVDAAVAATAAHLAEAVDAVAAQVEAYTAELSAIGHAVEASLSATNDRMAAIDFILLDSDGPDPEPTATALAQLRRVLRPPADP